MATLDLGENCGTFVFSQHVLLTHRFHNLPDDQKNDLEYTSVLAHTLYAMLLIDDLATDSKDMIWSLYEMDMLMEVSCSLSPRMNALYSYREITAHLARRLKLCQPKISVLRVAEILKYLCLIDLSRNNLEDCEVKLQGLGHILQIELFESSMNEITAVKDPSSFSFAVSPDRALMDPIRDIPHNDSSPILRRERFASPDFTSHERKCKCFSCANEAYKFLVFSATHIRAQLYTLQNLRHYARQHFEGALKIIERLLDLSRKEDNHQHYYVIDYVTFLLHYATFLKNDASSREEGRRIALWGQEICDIYQLKCHPVYFACMDIILEYQFEAIFSDSQLVSADPLLVIPGVDEIDVNEYMDPQPDGDILCLTPAKESGNSPRPRSRSRRRNNPPLLTFSKASVDIVESDPEELSPPLLAPDKRKKREVMKVKPVRRRLAADDDFEQDEEGSSSGRKSSGEKTQLGARVMKLVDDGVAAAPDLARKLNAIRKKVSEGTVSDDVIQKVIDVLEKGRAEYEKPRARSRSGKAEAGFMDVNGVEETVRRLKVMMPVETSGSRARQGSTASRSSSRSKQGSSPSTSSSRSRQGSSPSTSSSRSRQASSPSRSSSRSRQGSTASASSSGSRQGSASASSSGSRQGSTVSASSSRSRQGSSTSRSSSRSRSSKKEADSIASLAKDIERLSVRNSGASSGIDSDDEVVESSIIEPRRSRRLGGKNTTTDTKSRR